MYSRKPSPNRARAVSRCEHSARSWPVRPFPNSRSLRLGGETPAPARRSVTAVPKRCGRNASRHAQHVAGIPTACAVPAGITFAARPAIAVAAALAWIGSTIPTTAAPAEAFADPARTNTPTAWTATALTLAGKARCAATGPARFSVSIPETAARAGMSARPRPRCATGGLAVRRRAKAIARSGGVAEMAVAGYAHAPTERIATATGAIPDAHRTTRTIRTVDVPTFLMKGNRHVSPL
jgi:hypothetical protein